MGASGINNDVSRFVNTLYPEDIPKDAQLLVWTSPAKRSHWLDSVEDVPALIETLKDQNIYIGCGLREKAGFGPYERGKAEDVTYLPGLWADVDIAGPNHQKKNLPPDLDSALELVKIPVTEPTMIIHSGHGIQAWWCFKEFWEIKTPEARSEAEALTYKLHRALLGRAMKYDWTVDAVHDLARVMRLPGTTNHKGDSQIPVELLEVNLINTYNSGDLWEALPDGPPPRAQTKTAGKALILNPMAEAPRKIVALIANSEKFRDTWKREMYDLTDKSQSGYDMSLANQLDQADWTAQEIVDALIQHRREGGGKPKLRRNYYEATIAKAQQDREIPSAVADLENGVVAAAAGYSTPEDDEVARERIGKILGIPLTGVIKYMETPPRYSLLIGNQEVDIGGAGNLRSKSKVANAIIDAARIVIDIRPQSSVSKNWQAIISGLVQIAVEVTPAEESTENGETSAWVRGYIDELGVVRNPENLDKEIARRRSHIDRQGRLVIFRGELARYVRSALGENPGSAKVLSRRLKKIGFNQDVVYTVINGRRTSRSVFVLHNYHKYTGEKKATDEISGYDGYVAMNRNNNRQLH